MLWMLFVSSSLTVASHCDIFVTAVSPKASSNSLLTIGVINSYTAMISVSLEAGANLPTPLGNPQPTTIPRYSSTSYYFPTGWAGRVLLGNGPELDYRGSKIEGSFIAPDNQSKAVSDVDVSYVDGYSVPIICYSEGKVVAGCDIELFAQHIPCPQEENGVCINPQVNQPSGPAQEFFEACAGLAYVFPNDNRANAYDVGNDISCCVGSTCNDA